MSVHRRGTLLLSACLIASCVLCDRITKSAAASLRGAPPVHIASGLVTLSYAENEGAFLSLGAGLPRETRFLVFTVAVGVLLIVVAGVLLFARAPSRPLVIALSLILAGGASNLIDRLSHEGKVVDFLMLGAGGLRTGVFNVADIVLTAGEGLLLIAVIVKSRRTPQT